MLIEQVGVGTVKKKTFQTSLQNSPRLKKLFNGDLEEQIRSLKALAEDAETTWWTLARTEFTNKGEILTDGTVAGSPALAAVEEMCAGASVLMNQILVELAKIVTPAAQVTLNWSTTGTPVPADYDMKSFYGPYVGDVCDTLLTKVAAMKSLLSTTQNFAEFNSRVDNLKSTYAWAATEFQKFGPHFPTVFTDYYSNSGLGKSDYNKPEFGAGIDNTRKTLMLFNCPAGIDAGTTPFLADADGAGYAFHQLSQGDTVILTKLELDDYADHVGVQYEVADTSASLEGVYDDVLELKIGDTEFIEISTNDTERALAVGENFVLRKLARYGWRLAATTASVTQAAGTVSITLLAPAGVAWDCASDENFAVPAPLSGTGGRAIVVTYTENVGAQRTATITFTASQAGTPLSALTFVITQAAGGA